MRKDRVANAYQKLQEKICDSLERADGKASFQTDVWTKEIGAGKTNVLQDGDAIEKAAVNFSAVKGSLSQAMQKALQLEKNEDYFATGISSIIHPKNPFMPIIHMNMRYFELGSGKAWFGGGIDLTPHYIDIKEAAWFHRELKTLCDDFDTSFYPEYKKWADDYFYLPHRKETRGIGGVFFDHKDASSDEAFNKFLAFTSRLAEAYPRLYSKLLNSNRKRAFGEVEKKWQSLRRGRYVEFNLLQDRGTKFGLESNGRTESILLSMPPMASWTYDFQADKDSREEETLGLLKKGIDWLQF
jgi:coproporphyrinogen III oxidase